MANLTFKSDHEEYKNLIEQFIGNINPPFHVNAESALESIMKEFIATQNIRLGPAPSIEAQFQMRQVIRYYIHENEAIPVPVPSGPKKTKSNENVDVAELSMLNILNCLNNAIKLHHAPGIRVVMRLEDLTGKVLEPEEIPSMMGYIHSMKQLIKVLGYDFIIPWQESHSEVTDEFSKMVKDYTPLFEKYLEASVNINPVLWEQLISYKNLMALGWKGMIPLEQRQSYIDKYNKLYPDITDKECMTLVSKYFACGLARKNLNNKGNRPEWTGGYLEIAFMQPYHLFYPTRLNYRSIELRNSKKALSFWRAKGFLKVGNDNSVRISSCTWGEAENMDFFKGEIILLKDGEEAIVNCDFILE